MGFLFLILLNLKKSTNYKLKSLVWFINKNTLAENRTDSRVWPYLGISRQVTLTRLGTGPSYACLVTWSRGHYNAYQTRYYSPFHIKSTELVGLTARYYLRRDRGKPISAGFLNLECILKKFICSFIYGDNMQKLFYIFKCRGFLTQIII